MPSFRFGQGHIYNNYFLNSDDGINTRDGAQLLVENNVYSGVSKAIYSTGEHKINVPRPIKTID